jgi:hypothetical protein
MKPMDETLGLIESWIELTNPIANILDYVYIIHNRGGEG